MCSELALPIPSFLQLPVVRLRGDGCRGLLAAFSTTANVGTPCRANAATGAQGKEEHLSCRRGDLDLVLIWDLPLPPAPLSADAMQRRDMRLATSARCEVAVDRRCGASQHTRFGRRDASLSACETRQVAKPRHSCAIPRLGARSGSLAPLSFKTAWHMKLLYIYYI
jgi:hypothetical protein